MEYALGFIIATASGSVTAVVLHCLARRRDRRSEFNKAASIFRSAFVEEHRLLDPHSFADRTGKNAYDILTFAIDRHEQAMIEFRPYLNKRDRAGFDRAWRTYCYHDEKDDMPFLEQYADHGSVTKKEQKRKLALERIDKLLEFARPE